MLHKALEGAVMLHTFPKTTVDVFALVLESGGSMILCYTSLLLINMEHWIDFLFSWALVWKIMFSLCSMLIILEVVIIFASITKATPY